MTRSPKYCSSFRCSSPKSYCIDCSHAYFVGKAKHEGKIWGWAFNPHYGPVFNTDGKLDFIPEEDHPIWDKFETWLGRLQKHYAKNFPVN